MTDRDKKVKEDEKESQKGKQKTERLRERNHKEEKKSGTEREMKDDKDENGDTIKGKKNKSHSMRNSCVNTKWRV